MTSREKKLIVLLVAVALGSAGYTFWDRRQGAPDTADSGAARLAEARQAISGISAQSMTLPLTPAKQYGLRAAQRPLMKDPFAPVPDQAGKTAASSQSNAPSLLYSGYIEAGSNRLAIISGMEYAVNDAIPLTGDVVRQITSSHVVLYSPARKAEWELAYTGDEF